MDGTERRLSLAVLTAGAALALVAGGAWWVAAAPEAAPIPEPSTPAPSFAVQRHRDGPEGYLPDVPNTLERRVGTLTGDDNVHLIVASTEGNDYLLQHVCLGPGSLTVRISITDKGTELYQLDCGGSFGTIRFTAAQESLVVDVGRPDHEPAEVGVQVIALR